MAINHSATSKAALTQEEIDRAHAGIASAISSQTNPPLIVSTVGSGGNTVTGTELMRRVDPYNIGNAIGQGTLNFSVMLASNGYVIQTRKEVYVCTDLEMLRDNIVRMVASWEMDK